MPLNRIFVISIFSFFMLPCYSEMNQSLFFSMINEKINNKTTAQSLNSKSVPVSLSQHSHLQASQLEQMSPLIRQLIKDQIESYEASRPKCQCEKETFIQSVVDGPVGGAIGGWLATYGSRFLEFLFCFLITICKNRHQVVVNDV